MSAKPGVSTSPIPYSFIPSESEQDNPNKLFLGGVAAETTEKQLEEFFTQFGKVKDVRIVTDRITAACKGYGFVTFEDDENVEHLVARKTIRMNGAKLRIRKAIRRNASQFEHVSPTKKWLMMPSNMMQQTSAFLTPPNTPPSIEHLTLYEKDLKPPMPGARFLLKGKENMEGFPVLITTNSRSRTHSSPPLAMQSTLSPPSVIIPEEEAIFFPQLQPPPPSMYHQHPGRSRTYSTPITMHDYESLQHPSTNHPQTLLMTANQLPPKLYSPVPPTFTTQPNQGSQYLVPYYHHQPSENLMYCMQQPPQSLPYQTNPPSNNIMFK